jgi:hypothetical protein
VLSDAGCSVVGCAEAPDGTCSWTETCACPDCFSEPRCAPYTSSCEAGAPDGICADGEPCHCADCSLLGKCVEPFCVPQQLCGLFESCLCPGCTGDPACLKVKACQDDGACSPWEGCYCFDCASAAACAPLAVTCNGGAPDGDCQSGETCACLDCIPTEACVVCDEDGVCDAMEACVCSDCEEPLTQVGPGIWTANPCFEHACSGDGSCDTLSETCACADCAGSAWCADNVSACAGAALDGACDAAEPCACLDCWGKGKCAAASCSDDGTCDAGSGAEDLLCADCIDVPFGCFQEDGYCFPAFEGCGCADAPICSP